jgi:ribosome-associated translation inhibitor RaiA/DNA-directed RNA polymerase specialized sigma24 family protein
MAIAWNIVNNTGEAYEFVSDKVSRKIEKLETILRRFPEDAVHLQIILDEKPKRKSYAVNLNLRIPSNVLCVGKESKSLVRALDEASRNLILQLEKDKSRRRGEHLRKRPRNGEPPAPAFAELPLAEGVAPQSHADLVSEVLEANYERLLRFVNRQLSEHIAAGTIPEDAIDPRDIVDQVAEEVLSNPEAKPEAMDYPTWCSSLAFGQTRVAVRRYLTESSLSVPIDLDIQPNTDEGVAANLEVKDFALNILHDVVEPEEATLADYIEDTRSTPLDVSVAEREMVAVLRQNARSWPKLDREIFEMHYLEGLNAADIAVALHCDQLDIVNRLDRIQNTLRRRWLQIADSLPVGSSNAN